MAHDAALAARVERLLEGEPGYDSKRMFGGVAMMLAGNMAVGVIGTGLLVRAEPGEVAALLSEPGTRPFEMGAREARGWVVVVPEVLVDDDALRAWVERGVARARSLPPK